MTESYHKVPPLASEGISTPVSKSALSLLTLRPDTKLEDYNDANKERKHMQMGRKKPERNRLKW